MKVGLTGFPGTGKTTVFAALTGLPIVAGERKAQIGTIKVPDPRVETLAKIHNPKKTTLSEVTFVDFPPALDATRKAVLDQDMITALRDADALVQVVRGFPDVAGAAAAPADDAQAFSTE